MANEEKPITDIKGEGGGTIRISDIGGGKVLIKSTEPTTVVSKDAIKEAARKIADS